MPKAISAAEQGEQDSPALSTASSRNSTPRCAREALCTSADAEGCRARPDGVQRIATTQQAGLPEQNVVLVGARDLDEIQQDVLRRSAITWLPSAKARDADALVDALDVLAGRVDLVHLHVDLDVHDPPSHRPTATPPPMGCQLKRSGTSCG